MDLHTAIAAIYLPLTLFGFSKLNFIQFIADIIATKNIENDQPKWPQLKTKTDITPAIFHVQVYRATKSPPNTLSYHMEVTEAGLQRPLYLRNTTIIRCI